MPSEPVKQVKDNPKALWQALGLAWELGYVIALPLVILAFVGRLADKFWGTTPWFLLAGVLLSIIISTFLVLRKAQAIIGRSDVSDNIAAASGVTENKKEVRS